MPKNSFEFFTDLVISTATKRSCPSVGLRDLIDLTASSRCLRGGGSSFPLSAYGRGYLPCNKNPLDDKLRASFSPFLLSSGQTHATVREIRRLQSGRRCW